MPSMPLPCFLRPEKVCRLENADMREDRKKRRHDPSRGCERGDSKSKEKVRFVMSRPEVEANVAMFDPSENFTASRFILRKYSTTSE